MTWFKVDDSFYDHPKVFDAPDCAVALWVRAGSWSARNLTDGFVPAKMPARLCDDPDTAVRELVRRGLWSRVKDGFRFHDWDSYQPSRESVERDRDAAAERQRRRRARAKGQVTPDAGTGEVTQVSRRDGRVTTTVTHGVSSPSPSRPDPTSTSPDGEVRGAPPRNAGATRASARAPAQRATRIPEDFQPDEAMRAWFVEHCPGVDGLREHAKFVDHWRSESGTRATKRDWPATWRNWMRRAADDGPRRRPQPAPTTKSTTDERVAGWLALGDQLSAHVSGQQAAIEGATT